MLTKYCKDKILKFESISGIREADVIIDKQYTPKDNTSTVSNNTDTRPSDTLINPRDNFIKDGEQLFRFLIDRFSHKNKPAFFSYLYFYLKQKNKLAIFDVDSIEYRTFIMQEFKLESFSRIQTTQIENEKSKKFKMFKLFDESYLEFYQLKGSEENLNTSD